MRPRQPRSTRTATLLPDTPLFRSPRTADLWCDSRCRDKPHWQDDLRPLTGLDAAVGEQIARDPAYGEALERIGGLIEFLLPRYAAEGKAYITLAFGCTGGRHRSVDRKSTRLNSSH